MMQIIEQYTCAEKAFHHGIPLPFETHWPELPQLVDPVFLEHPTFGLHCDKKKL
jgi:hypothetical protein